MREVLNDVIRSLKRDDPYLAKCLKKWSGYLLDSVNRASHVTAQDPEDLLQELLGRIVETRMMYQLPLYRYKKAIYQLVDEDGSLVKLKIPAYRKTKTDEKPFWVHRYLVTPVKKAKLESMIYTGISQQYCDLLASHFIQRKGYRVTGHSEQLVKIRSAKDGQTYRKKKVRHIEQFAVPVDYDSLDSNLYQPEDHHSTYYEDRNSLATHCGSQTPEDLYGYAEYLHELKARLPESGPVVLDCMIDHIGISDHLLSRRSGVARREVAEIREIISGWADLLGRESVATGW